jgi:nucleoid-associated protein YgaU
MGKDYRIGLIAGTILAGFALLWVATRPSLTPGSQPRPSVQHAEPSRPTAGDRAGLTNLRPLLEAGIPPSNLSAPAPPREPAAVSPDSSSAVAARDANGLVDKPARFHVVRPGETLSGIAEQYYGSPNAWRKILDANKSLKDANKIAPGAKLVIPD